MPRRDVVITAMIAFGAGVAVGANWKELRKKIGPALGKLGVKISDLGDLLSAANWDGFQMPNHVQPAKKPSAKKAKVPKKKANAKIQNGSHPRVSSVSKPKPAAVRRNGHRPSVPVATETSANLV